ncbi:SPOR domain-containing protein [Novosphingobium album (ex Hu et al. 2023)]|uniref:SPOR domain-containing protein n=1 Tax=Novosphingobium album (ex Hu et al. 2023) TaxID=2930093 RepID=A0ABT0B0F1_9SPHN|nr:SPOR domain-containing protein [Novosphingobium album (ex Hu et al. 2023)]MCJ2178490.1 SPOR domain-containing protein [Novosphingobium album (ex Hu et al. 2023)]
MAISDTGREDLNGDPNFSGQNGSTEPQFGTPQYDPPPFSPPPFDPPQYDPPQYDQQQYDQQQYDPQQNDQQQFGSPQYDPAPFEPAPVSYEPATFEAPASETSVEPLPFDSSTESGTESDTGFEQPPQLELGDDSVTLPWLEGDDEEFEDNGGPGIGQGLMLVVLGLVAIGVIVGGLFWVMRDKPDQPLVADGGVIAAPKEPYKTKPENPGGEVVAGTGDTSFAVAEGQARPPQIEDKPEAAKPGFETVGKPDSRPEAKPSEAAAPSGGVGVQVGAYSTRKSAEAGWNALKSQYPALGDVSHRILQGQADIGTVYRLQAVPGNLAAAKALCSGMKDAGLSCQVKN